MHDEIKAAARKSLEQFIKQGMKPGDALKKVQATYVDDVVAIMANEINSLKIGTITPPKLKKMALDKIDLSTNLYNHANDVNRVVLAEINKHTKDLNNARKLALKIYEGYNFNPDELLDVKNQVPKYLFDPLKQMNAKQLKTPALKAAYLQLLEAQSENDLKKALKVAMYERNRYFANRIAQTELHRIQTRAKVQGILEDDGIEIIQIRMSATHPKVDICDYHAGVDMYGLGKGCYPKNKAPMPPYHPFCRCRAVPRVDIDLSDAKPVNGDPDKNLMAQFSDDEQAMVLGSKGRLDTWRTGQGSITDLYDEGKKPLYRLKRADEVDYSALVPDVNGNELLSPLSVTIPFVEKIDYIQNKEKFDDWYYSEPRDQDRIPVATISGKLAELIGASSFIVWLSGWTAKKQLDRHPDITYEHYTLLNSIETPDSVFLDNEREVVFFYVSNKLYKVALKSANNGEEVFLQSFHESDLKNIKRKLRKSELIYNRVSDK